MKLSERVREASRVRTELSQVGLDDAVWEMKPVYAALTAFVRTGKPSSTTCVVPLARHRATVITGRVCESYVTRLSASELNDFVRQDRQTLPVMRPESTMSHHGLLAPVNRQPPAPRASTVP